MGNLVRFLGYETNLGTVRRELFNILAAIHDLSEDEKVDGAHLLVKNVDCLKMFMGCLSKVDHDTCVVSQRIT